VERVKEKDFIKKKDKNEINEEIIIDRK